MKIVNFLMARLRKVINQEVWLKDHIRNGMKIGSGCNIQNGLIVDYSNAWLIEVGNNVTIAPHVYLLAHDASTKRNLKFTKIGRVIIEDECFVGARSIVMPGVTLGKKTIVAAGSVVTKSFPAGSVIGGNPARFICTTEDYLNKQQKLADTREKFDQSYAIDEIDQDKKEEMRVRLAGNKLGIRF